MPTVSAAVLRRLGNAFFSALGCSAADARTVTDHLVQSNLYGHDSHGMVRMRQYAESVREKRVVDPQAIPEIAREHACTAVVDAHNGFGQVGATFATELLIDKARANGIAAVSLRNTSHIGRVGAYPLLVAQAGMIGHIYVNAGRLGFQVAPFGGIDGRLGTNPLAFAAPRRDAPPFFVDMTTSTVADGKIRVAANAGKPSTRPEDYVDEPHGAILPLGGPLGHKGTALSMMIEVCGGGMSGQGMSAGDMRVDSNGVLLIAYDIAQFVEPDFFYDEMEALISHVKSSRTAEGVQEILIAGEPEYRAERERAQSGIPIDETTWEHICADARGLGLDPRLWQLD